MFAWWWSNEKRVSKAGMWIWSNVGSTGLWCPSHLRKIRSFKQAVLIVWSIICVFHHGKQEKMRVSLRLSLWSHLKVQLRGFTSGSLHSEKTPTYVWLTALLWLHFTHMGWTKSFIFRSEYSSHNARKTPSHILVSYYSWKLMSLESQFVSCRVGLPWYNDANTPHPPPPKRENPSQTEQTRNEKFNLLPFCLWCVLYLFQAIWFGEGGVWVNNICKSVSFNGQKVTN